MPRKLGSTNRGKNVEHQLLQHGKRQWRYRGKLFSDHLDIHHISGVTDGDAVALDQAIKRECRRLGVVVNLDDPVAADMMFKHIAVAA